MSRKNFSLIFSFDLPASFHENEIKLESITVDSGCITTNLRYPHSAKIS